MALVGFYPPQLNSIVRNENNTRIALNMTHPEHHRIHRSGWLRATVLGANDGIVSTASLIVGVAVGGASKGSIVLAGTAGLVAGAMSMAAGEYVSVQSQADTESADIKIETDALENNRDDEQNELAAIFGVVVWTTSSLTRWHAS